MIVGIEYRADQAGERLLHPVGDSPTPPMSGAYANAYASGPARCSECRTRDAEAARAEAPPTTLEEIRARQTAEREQNAALRQTSEQSGENARRAQDTIIGTAIAEFLEEVRAMRIPATEIVLKSTREPVAHRSAFPVRLGKRAGVRTLEWGLTRTDWVPGRETVEGYLLFERAERRDGTPQEDRIYVLTDGRVIYWSLRQKPGRLAAVDHSSPDDDLRVLHHDPSWSGFGFWVHRPGAARLPLHLSRASDPAGRRIPEVGRVSDTKVIDTTTTWFLELLAARLGDALR
jgi:hypothetical protein